MATQKRPLTKLLCPLPHPGHEFRVGLLHLKNVERMKALQAFPQVGELPAVAGLLLYPDKHEKMVTTTEIAFGPKAYSRTEPKKILKCHMILEGDQSYITTNQEAYRAQALRSEPLMMRKSPVRCERTPTAHYQTHYQQSFVRPQFIYGRRLQALPRPDNLAVNPALRVDFKTVQKETYPGWDTSLHSRPLPAQLKEQLSLTEKAPKPCTTTKMPSSSVSQRQMIRKSPHCLGEQQDHRMKKMLNHASLPKSPSDLAQC